MTFHPQFLVAPDGSEMVLLLRADYERLLAGDDDAADNAAADRALAESEDRYPAEVVDAMIDGATPVAAWRSYRKLTQAALANRTGLTQAAIARLETRKNGKVPIGRLETRRALAKALDIFLSALDPLEA